MLLLGLVAIGVERNTETRKHEDVHMMHNECDKELEDWLYQFQWRWVCSIKFERSYGNSQIRDLIEQSINRYATGTEYFGMIDRKGSPCHRTCFLIKSSAPAFIRLPLQHELNYKYGRSKIMPYRRGRCWCSLIARHINRTAEFFTNFSPDKLGNRPRMGPR
jgi:hypothetical protein